MRPGQLRCPRKPRACILAYQTPWTIVHSAIMYRLIDKSLSHLLLALRCAANRIQEPGGTQSQNGVWQWGASSWLSYTPAVYCCKHEQVYSHWLQHLWWQVNIVPVISACIRVSPVRGTFLVKSLANCLDLLLSLFCSCLV